MNPLYNEYKKSQLRTFIVVLCLAFAAAVFDYFIALNQRIAQQQNLLNSAVEDLEHQFGPLLHLMTVLKADAELTLLADQQSDATNAGGWYGVEFLNACGLVHAEGPVPLLGDYD